MSIFGSLFKLITSILKKVFNAFKKLFKMLLPILIIVAVVYFGAPYLSSFFTGLGAPTWLTSAISALPGYISSGLTYLWDKTSILFDLIKEGASSLFKWYKQLDIGTQAMIGLGVSYAIAPEETAQLVEDVAAGIGDLAETVIGAALGGGFGTLLFIGLAAYLLLNSGNDDRPIVVRERANA